jgi:hypothetical protein
LVRREEGQQVSIQDYLEGRAMISKNKPFHELIESDFHAMKCTCGKSFYATKAHGLYSPEQSRRIYLDHLEEMVLRERREREIYIFEQQTRPRAFLTQDLSKVAIQRLK